MKDKPEHQLPEFVRLQTSISLALFKQQIEEPQYEALDRHSHNSDRFSRLSEYAMDIIRIFRELELARSLVVTVPTEEFLTAHGSTREDYVMYHSGHFLDLVHQLKDKLTQLVKGLTTPPPFIELKDPNPLLLAEEQNIKELAGLSDLLKIWTQAPDKKHGIAVALRRRAQYHHFRNRLHLNNDFLDVKLFRTMQTETAQKMLSEEGKKLMEEKGENGFKNWHTKVADNMTNTINDVKDNLEAISKILNDKLSLPLLEKDAPKIFDDYHKMQESLKIKPVASPDHYNKTIFYPLIKLLETSLPLIFGEHILSIYLVGSTTRGDALLGTSDINFVVVVRDEAEALLPTVKQFVENMQRGTKAFIDCTVKTESTFKATGGKLIRFICKTDGLLLTGVDLVGDEVFPKPSLALGCLFKEKIREDILEVKKELEQPALSQERVSFLARKVAKSALRLMFIAVMADTARHERNFDEMYKLVLEKYPENKKMTDTFYDLVKGEGTLDTENLKNLMSAFDSDSSLGALMGQLDEKCEQLQNNKYSE